VALENKSVASSGLRTFRWLWAAFVVFATSLPYLLNRLRTPAGFHYTWILPPYPQDSLAYMAWAQQAAHGSLLFKVKYTALPQSAFLFHPFFLICGWLSRIFSLEIGIVLFLMKAAGTVLFLFLFYRYTDYLKFTGFQSALASILVTISSGLGWIIVLLGFSRNFPNDPADLWMPEVNTYWSLLWNPLFPYSLALILLVVYLLDRGTHASRNRDLWFAGLATGCLALIHPYSLPLLFALAVVITAVRQRQQAVSYLARYFVAVLPFLTYVVVVTRLEPVLAKHSASGQMNSPSLWAYLIGFGIPLLLLLAGVVIQRGEWLKQYWQLGLWFVLSLIFSYLPLWFQRKLIFGAQIPLCLLAAVAVDLLLNRLFRAYRRKWALVFTALIVLPLLLATQVYLLAGESKDVAANIDGDYYINNEVMEGFNFLRAQSDPNDIVFSLIPTSRLIPAFTGNTVLWGHWAMAVDEHEREDWLADLFHPRPNWNDPTRCRKFWDTGIEYIFADGDLKRSVANNSRMWRSILDNANEVFVNDGVVIYKRREGLPDWGCP
jgi:hypothetical protein